MIYIIGSGPAGVSAAVAMVKKGINVTMLDAGFELEPERAKVIRRLQSLDKKDWDDGSISILKENMIANVSGIDSKYVYGSDYPYRGMDRYQPVKLKGAKMKRSLARGGLSNSWGASILPYRENDIKEWPINIKELEPYYRSVLSFMPLSGKADELNSILPLYGDCQKVSICKQVSDFLEDLESNKDSLNAEGFLFGHSRLAVNFAPQPNSRECNYCCMCLYGCPYALIYSSNSTLDWLLSNKNFQYIKDVLVEKLVETDGGIKILAKSLMSDEKLEYRGSRVFLAAGTVSSTRIMLQSLEAFNRPLAFKHSDHFQIPLLRYKKTKNVKTEEMHTLTQLNIELIDKAISENTIHMQIYAYNDFYDGVMNNLLGPVAPIFKRPVEEFLGRLLIIKGYLHSNISSQISVYLESGNNGDLVLEGLHNSEAEKAFKKIKTKLLKSRKYFKAIPSPKMAKLDLPGVGNHSGGTFPMKKNPSDFESDKYGRPYGFEKVYIVDSSVFPSIPATTITLTIMANAFRIATEVMND